MRKLLIPLALLCAIPAAWLLQGAYLAGPATVTVSSRRLSISDSGDPRKPFRFDAQLEFTNHPAWAEPLATAHFEDALMFFDTHSPGTTLPRTALYARRATIGWSLAAFAALFLFAAYVLVSNPNSGWLFRPQRTFALVAFLPLTGGYLLHNYVEQRRAWPRVQAEVVTLELLKQLQSRAPGLEISPALAKQLRTADLETIRYTYSGRVYLYPYGAGVAMPTPQAEKQIDPANPASLSDLPPANDGKALGAWLLLGAGALFLVLGLLVP